MKFNSRDALRRVLKQATAAGVAELAPTDLLLGFGRRDSDARTYSGFDLARIHEWTDDIDASHINWPLSATTGFDPLLVVEFAREENIDWKVLTDCSLTMDFGTCELKRVTAAVLTAIFALTVESVKDSIGQVIYDEYGKRIVTGQMSGNELLGSGLPLYLEAVSEGLDSSSRTQTSGLAEALRYLPDDLTVVPVISDFIHFPAETREALLRATRHRLMCCVIDDPRERGFDNTGGQITVLDMNTGAAHSMSAAEANRTVAADYAKRMADLKKFFEDSRIPYEVFGTDDTPQELGRKVIKLLHRRMA